MTFKGVTYESIVDIERLIIVSECRLDIFNLELNKCVMQNDKVGADEVRVKINLENNFLNEVKERKEFLLEEMDKLANDLNDMEYKVFIAKFMKGKTNKEIQSELFITERWLMKICNKIWLVMKDTPYGEDIMECLRVD